MTRANVPSSAEAITAPGAASSTGLHRRFSFGDSGLLIIFIVLFVVLSATVPYFLTTRNMVGLALSVAQLGMVACTMMFCLASRDFDLSVGSTVAFAGVSAVMVMNATGSIVLGIVCGLLCGVTVGFVNGYIIARIKINALITTLATMEMVRGLAYIVTGGRAVGVSDADFFVIGNAQILGVPAPIWITVICFVVFGVLLNKSVYGRNTLAIGGNPDASRLAGVDVEKTRIIIFTVQGMICGLAGIILASRITSGQPNSSLGFELSVISACVLGGVSLAGGRATIRGVVVGVLIMGTLQDAMNLMDIPVFYQYLVRGTILLLAVGFDQLRVTRRRKA
jgi:L-arabinose transport system permease protein